MFLEGGLIMGPTHTAIEGMHSTGHSSAVTTEPTNQPANQLLNSLPAVQLKQEGVAMLVDQLLGEQAPAWVQAPEHPQVQAVHDWEGGEDWEGQVTERHAGAAKGQALLLGDGGEAALNLSLPALGGGACGRRWHASMLEDERVLQGFGCPSGSLKGTHERSFSLKS